MRQGYYGFYWTLPVPWYGFVRLSSRPAIAARQSRTIAYCRNRVRAHVRQAGGRMLGEVALMEAEPDRGSPELAAEFRRLLDKAQREGARVAVVDFSDHRNWRRHWELSRHYEHPACDVIEADPAEVQLSHFNPWAHFEEWRERTRANIAGKGDHRAQILAALETVEGSFPVRAAALNLMELKTHGGKPWTGDNLRKFLQAGG